MKRARSLLHHKVFFSFPSVRLSLSLSLFSFSFRKGSFFLWWKSKKENFPLASRAAYCSPAASVGISLFFLKLCFFKKKKPECRIRHPPGTEIYRDRERSISVKKKKQSKCVGCWRQNLHNAVYRYRYCNTGLCMRIHQVHAILKGIEKREMGI